MKIGEIIMTAIGCFVLAIISGIIARNIFVAIVFPILLVSFLLMWRNLKKNEPKKEEIKEEVVEENVVNDSYPPVSTNYPPKVS